MLSSEHVQFVEDQYESESFGIIMLSVITMVPSHFVPMPMRRNNMERKRRGGSNAGSYRTKGPFCGPAGGAPRGTFPVNTRKRAQSALAYARNAPKPAGIKRCVCRHWPTLPACKKDDAIVSVGISSLDELRGMYVDGMYSVSAVVETIIALHPRADPTELLACFMYVTAK